MPSHLPRYRIWGITLSLASLIYGIAIGASLARVCGVITLLLVMGLLFDFIADVHREIEKLKKE